MEFNNRLLSEFCNGDQRRQITCRPWSVGEYSYATNGHIMVRVAQSADVEKATQNIKVAATIDKWIADLADIQRDQPPRLDIPKAKRWGCKECDGRGFKHDCPDCSCECDECDGGWCYQRMAIAWCGFHVEAKLWRLITALPNSMLATAINPAGHIGFTFDGGAGIVMPMRPNLEDDDLIIDARIKSAA